MRDYFATNVTITTSGQFTSPGLRHCIEEIGTDRIMFSIDTPYEDADTASAWFNSAPLSPAERLSISRANAIKLLKLKVSAPG